MKLHVLVNPKAGSGSAARKIPEIVRALERAGLPHRVVQTRGPGDAARLVREARADGVDCIAVVGGDGTLNEVSQGYLDASGAPLRGPDLALIPAGTGGDFRRTLRVPTEVSAAVERLAAAEPRALDLGVLELTSPRGETRRHAFINITSFGIGGLTDRIVNESPKWMGGRAAFFLGTLRAMFAYENAPVRVKVDDRVFLEGRVLNVAIANGRYFGGGMKIAPDADPGDGAFDVVALGDIGRLQGVALSRRIYEGTHTRESGVTLTRGARVEAEALGRAEVLIDMDGETPGRLPLVASIARGIVRVRA